MEYGPGVVGGGDQRSVGKDGKVTEGDYSGTFVRDARENGRGDGGGELLRNPRVRGFGRSLGF